MLIKGFIFLLICLLFVSRLIPKYGEFRDTNQVQLFSITWEGELGLIVLLGIAVMAIILLGMSLQNFYLFFSRANKNENTD